MMHFSPISELTLSVELHRDILLEFHLRSFVKQQRLKHETRTSSLSRTFLTRLPIVTNSRPRPRFQTRL